MTSTGANRLLVGEVFRRQALARPARPAASLDGRVLTFADVEDGANRVGHVVRNAGIGHGDRVAWWGDTSLDAVPLFAALAKLGAAFAPLNARLGAAEAAPVVELARPALLVVDDSRIEPAQSLGVPVVTIGELLHRASQAGAAGVVEPELDEDDAHVIFFTSGSTGRPKGVVVSHRASFLRSFPSGMPAASGCAVCMFPMFHMAAWSIALGCWQAGREVAFVSTPDADTLLATVAARRARRLYAIPAVWARILEADLGSYDLSTLRETDTGTSATPPELLHAIRAAFPQTETRVFYGSTEAGPGTHLAPEDLARKPGSVGLAAPGVEVRIDDGEVCMRSPFLMTGYFDDPGATAAALADGWYRTGDLGVLDDEGYLSIVGRARDVIRTGGETVAPSEVEAVVSTHPAVADVAVVGVPDPQWGEVVCAVVVARAGSDLTLDGLREHCRPQLACFKHPRRLELVDALPRTAATGQVQRSLIVERIVSRRR